MRIEARAKINWTLDITGQRPDGYHLMDMLMQPVTLADDITLAPADEIILTTDAVDNELQSILDGVEHIAETTTGTSDSEYTVIFSQYGDVYLLTSYGSLIAFFIMGAALLAMGVFISL